MAPVPERPVSALMGAGRSDFVHVVLVLLDRAWTQDRKYPTHDE